MSQSTPRCVAVLFVGVIAVSVREPMCADNLLPNPSFEQLDEKARPEGWVFGFYRGQGRIETTDEQAHSGRRSLRMSALQDAAGQCMTARPLPVESGLRYRVDVWVRSDTGRAQIQIRWQNATRGLPEQYAINVFDIPPNLWRRLSSLTGKNRNVYHRLGTKQKLARLTPDELVFAGAKEVRLFLFCRANETVYYDDVELSPVVDEQGRPTALDEDAQREFERLQMDREPVPYPEPKPAKPVIIESPEFPKSIEPSSAFPPHGVTTRDGCFFRNKRHRFYLGAESGPPRPGIMRLLGFRVHAMTGTSTYDNNWTVVKDEGDRIRVTYREWVPLGPKLRDSIRYGFLPIVQTINHAKSSLLRRFGRADLVVDQGHFIAYCPDQTVSRKMRENFWRSVMQVAAPYPILGYEHFNELGYMCYCKPSRDAFKRAMQRKYTTIERANRSWGTNFTSFAEADPPYRKRNNTAEGIAPEGFSRPLWADWVRFTEDHFGEHMRRLMKSSRGWDPAPDHYRCIQSHLMLRLDYVGGGVNPVLKGAAEEMFGFEVGQTFFPQESGKENVEEIEASFVGLPLHGAVVSSLTRDKPVVNLEGGVHRAGQQLSAQRMDAISLLPVQGQWQLRLDPEKRGIEERWFAPDFDDVGWQAVPINDVWDKHGYADYDGWGWYRKTVEVPAALRGERLWLNGKGLDDEGRVYLNGRLLGETRGWNREFSFEITGALDYGRPNTFAILVNDTGLYGGLRFFLGVNDFDLMRPNPLTRGMMRLYLWNHVVYGLDCAALSYFYSAESWPGSLFSPYKCSAAAIKAIAETEREIDSVADIVLPKPRIEGQFALVYPLETFRAYVPATTKDWVDFHATRDFLRYLTPLFCSDVDVDVLHSKHLLEGWASRYRAVILRQYERATPEIVKALEDYVRGGGTLVVDHSSLRLDDNWYTPLDVSRLTGVRTLGQRRDVRGIGGDATRPRRVDSATGVRVKLLEAKPVLRLDDGSPALTLRELGAGRVFFVAAELPYGALSDFIERLIGITGARPEITVRDQDGRRLPFCESHLFGRRGRWVAIIANYGGGDRRIAVRMPQVPEGAYRVRDVETGRVVGEWVSAARLRSGITLELPPLQPLVLLVEAMGLSSTPLTGLSPTREAEIADLWANNAAADRWVLFDANYPRTDIATTYCYTARRMLNKAGFQWQMALSPFTHNDGRIRCFDGDSLRDHRLSDFKVLVIPSMHVWAHDFEPAEDQAIREFVENGGGVLFLGRSFDRSSGFKALAQFGIRDTNDLILDAQHCADGEPYYVRYTDIAPHPVTRGVKVFQSRGGSHIIPDADSIVLIRGPTTASTRSGQVQRPVICVAKQVGKGRIAVVGDHRWTDPVFLQQGDNARLWLNLIQWLAGLEPPP